MGNNYYFWEQYLNKLYSEINELCKKKKTVYIDFHLHSNYSADGNQTLKEIIQSTKGKGFDIIAITDHDSIKVYDELYEYLRKENPKLLIVPGVEFTMDNKEYGNQCHILKLFINPKDKDIIKNIKKNQKAMYNRSKIQFKRLKENKTITEIQREYKIKISYREYLKYLNKNNYVPEYNTLCNYLIEKFKEKQITTFYILNLLEKNNELDIYLDRKQFKRDRYKKIREKYQETPENQYNERFLLSMLAVKEVDDDWWNKPSSGSLSVNSYGQLKIPELNKKYKTFFAHPTEFKLNIVEKIIVDNPFIIGLEKNIRNNYKDISSFENLLKNKKLYKIIGSDSHDNKLNYCRDISYFEIESKELLKLINSKEVK